MPPDAPDTGQGTSAILGAAPAAPPAQAPAASSAPGGGAAPAAAPAAVPAAAPIPWLPNADEATVGYVQNKAWTEPAQVLDGYRNLERLLGADRAGNSVILPKADATPAEREAFFNRLGRPAEPAGYKVEVPKEFGDAEFAKEAQAAFHKLGLTKDQGEELVKWWNSKAGGMTEAAKQARVDAFNTDQAALKAEWGAAHGQRVEEARAAAKALGLSGEDLDRLDASLGHKGTMTLLQKIGTRVMEPEFVSGGRPAGFGGQMTPAQAKAKLDELMHDKAWVARFAQGDANARAEKEKLVGFAYPEGV
jgi:hypothetical protein